MAAAFSLAPTPAAVSAPICWNPLLRVGFRFCFSYFAIWILLNGNATIWTVVPLLGEQLGSWAHLLPVLPADWLAPHVFHLTGVAAHAHPTGSGDTAIDWIVTGIFVFVAALGTLVWSMLDRRRQQYQTLLAWLRFALRLSIGASLLGYCFYKLFPLQMPPPSLARLNEPVGQLSPMALLWTFLGVSPLYEMVCGLAEIAAGLLLLVRRTALLGALVTAFVASNIVLYNFLFDVPVKLFSLHLLMGALFIALPDAKALYSFFWKHQPAAPGGVWVPPAQRPGFRRATFIFELVFLVLVLGESAVSAALGYRAVRTNNHNHSPLQGAWAVQQTQPGTALNAFQKLFVENTMEPKVFWVQPVAQNEQPAWGRLDTAKHVFTLGLVNGPGQTFNYVADGPDRLLLAAKPGHPTYTLLRLKQPEKWPLLSRGFHLVSEYPYQR